MSIAQSCVKQATGQSNDNGIDDYKQPKAQPRSKSKDKGKSKSNRNGRSVMGMQVAQSVSDEEAKAMRPQRNAKGQYLSGHDGQFKPGNQAAKKLGLKEVPVHIAEDLTPVKIFYAGNIISLPGKQESVQKQT